MPYREYFALAVYFCFEKLKIAAMFSHISQLLVQIVHVQGAIRVHCEFHQCNLNHVLCKRSTKIIALTLPVCIKYTANKVYTVSSLTAAL